VFWRPERKLMPNRILREGILESERIDKIGPMSELFYRRLMSVDRCTLCGFDFEDCLCWLDEDYDEQANGT
jgi:hypothetical protein